MWVNVRKKSMVSKKVLFFSASNMAILGYPFLEFQKQMLIFAVSGARGFVHFHPLTRLQFGQELVLGAVKRCSAELVKHGLRCFHCGRVVVFWLFLFATNISR